VILSGRRVNDGMGTYVAQRVAKLLAASGKPPQARVGILGFTFKRTYPISGIRRSSIFTRSYANSVQSPSFTTRRPTRTISIAYGIEMEAIDEFADLSALILAVPHAKFDSITGESISGMIEHGGVFIDVKSCVNPASLRSDITYWSL
jgi:UDP-N-acetyl-D-galactosamine dehydrogenase